MTPEEALKSLTRSSAFRTVCEVHREIYDECSSLDEPLQSKIKSLVLEAFIMVKKMDAKLREYKSDWDAGFYEVNTDRRSDRHRRAG